MLSTSIASRTGNAESEGAPGTRIIFYLSLSVILLVLALSLKPLMIDGDGAYHSARAMYEGSLSGMDPKHPLAAAVLRAIYLPLRAAGWERASLTAFTAFSAACGAGTFFLLAYSIFPRFIGVRSISLLGALGAFVSYGVLSRASTIEVYAPALFLDVALVAHCLRASFERGRDAVIAGLLLILAVGFHVANLLIVPGAIALAIARAPRGRIAGTLLWGGATFLAGMGAILVLLWLGPGQAKWPPDPALIVPRGAHQPPLGVVGHLSRAAYGFARTVAFLPYIRDLRAALAVPYGLLVGGGALLCLHLARGGLLADVRSNGRLLMMLALLSIPFLLVGVYYYPSDVERWLFLMPALWLLVGLAWDQHGPTAGRPIVALDSPILLGAMVIGLAGYNAAALLPEALADRRLAGLKELSERVAPGDLLISPAGVGGRIHEFYLDRPIRAENLTVMDLVKEHGADVHGLQANLAGRINRALEEGRRVFAFDLIGEGHEKQKGYPWSFIPDDYGPDTFLAVLERYPLDPIYPPDRDHVGIVRLGPRPRSGGGDSAPTSGGDRGR